MTLFWLFSIFSKLAMTFFKLLNFVVYGSCNTLQLAYQNPTDLPIQASIRNQNFLVSSTKVKEGILLFEGAGFEEQPATHAQPPQVRLALMVNAAFLPEPLNPPPVLPIDMTSPLTPITQQNSLPWVNQVAVRNMQQNTNVFSVLPLEPLVLFPELPPVPTAPSANASNNPNGSSPSAFTKLLVIGCYTGIYFLILCYLDCIYPPVESITVELSDPLLVEKHLKDLPVEDKPLPGTITERTQVEIILGVVVCFCCLITLWWLGGK